MVRVARLLLRVLVLRILRVRATYNLGSIELLKRGRVIVCSNHVSFLDGVVVALISPSPLVFGVDSEFSRQSKFSRRGLAVLSFLGFGRVVPIDSSAPFGLRALYKALANGESVMIFPEGCISETGEPLPDQPGVEWLVQRAHARIVRIQISGAEKSRFFAKSGRSFWPVIKVLF